MVTAPARIFGKIEPMYNLTVCNEIPRRGASEARRPATCLSGDVCPPRAAANLSLMTLHDVGTRRWTRIEYDRLIEEDMAGIPLVTPSRRRR
jgi:hypothetical protein